MYSFTMLTINADEHPMMKLFQKPKDDKRMVVILLPERFSDWLHDSENKNGEFLQAFPAERMTVMAPQVNGQLC